MLITLLLLARLLFPLLLIALLLFSRLLFPLLLIALLLLAFLLVALLSLPFLLFPLLLIALLLLARLLVPLLLVALLLLALLLLTLLLHLLLTGLPKHYLRRARDQGKAEQQHCRVFGVRNCGANYRENNGLIRRDFWHICRLCSTVSNLMKGSGRPCGKTAATTGRITI